MIDSYCRKPYQTLCVNPVIPLFSRFHPHTVTLLGCGFGLATCPLLFAGFPWLAFLALVLSGFFDTLDGSLARHLQLTSPKGAFLDIVCDRMVESAVVLGLFLVEPETRGLPCLLILMSVLLCITTFLVTGIFAKNQSKKSFFYSPGLVERCEAFLFFATMILFPSNFFFAAYLFAALTLFTAFLRLGQFLSCHD